MWASSGVLSNPTSGTVLADTGALSVGVVSYTVLVWVGNGGGITLTLRLRNALNTADVSTQRFFASTAQPLMQVPINPVLNQRLTVTNDETLLTDIQVSIIS